MKNNLDTRAICAGYLASSVHSNAYGPRDGNLRPCSCSHTSTRYVCIYNWSMLTFLNLLIKKDFQNPAGKESRPLAHSHTKLQTCFFEPRILSIHPGVQECPLLHALVTLLVIRCFI